MPHRGTCTRKVTRVAPQAGSKRRRTRPGPNYAPTAKLKSCFGRNAKVRGQCHSNLRSLFPIETRRTAGKGARVKTPHSLASAPTSLTHTRHLFSRTRQRTVGARRQSCQRSPSLAAVGNQKFSKEWCIGGDSSAGSGPTTQSQGLALYACCKAAPQRSAKKKTGTLL